MTVRSHAPLIGAALAPIGPAVAPTHAALVNGTTAGGKGTVIDTVNQTEWLDIDEAEGLSPNAAVAANPGFRWATIDDMNTLLDQFFAINPPAPSTFVLANNASGFEVVSTATADAWTALFGNLALTAGSTQGYLDDGADDGNQDTFELNLSGGTPIIGAFPTDLGGLPDGDLFADAPLGSVGVYLVRVIPEPASLALLGIGGLMLIDRRRRIRTTIDGDQP